VPSEAMRAPAPTVTRRLLDTTFLIDADRAGDQLKEIIEDDDDVAIAAITVAEMQVGALLSDGKRREARQAFVDDVLVSIPVLEYDVDVAVVHADLLGLGGHQSEPRGAHDLIIAATARASGRIVVTADVTAFDDLPEVQTRLHG
jgi:tRNA(fMet)-specific endonuclease VapC